MVQRCITGFYYIFKKGEVIMLTRKGFTLVELMVVILIVAILAAVAIPIMRGRLDAAKWTEGKAMMGTIATSIRAYCAEKDPATLTGVVGEPAWAALGLAEADFRGTYFQDTNFSWAVTYLQTSPTGPQLTFVVTATKGTGISSPDQYTLNEKGVWGTGVVPPP